MDRQIEIPSTREFLEGVGRAFAGALIFALPMLMTMEMWWLGFNLHPWRIILLLVVTLPLLFGLSRFSGFRATAHWIDEIADIFVALLVSMVTAGAILWLFGLITAETSLREVIGKLAMQIVPCSIGAMLARSQLGGGDDDRRQKREPSYGGEMFLMMTGALFLSLNVAPTEEIILIAYQMSAVQEILLALLSLALIQIFVYAVQFRGSHSFENMPTLSVFLRYSVVGYAIVLLVSLSLVWLMGHADGKSLGEILSTVVVLGFPGAMGAAAARLVL